MRISIDLVCASVDVRVPMPLLLIRSGNIDMYAEDPYGPDFSRPWKQYPFSRTRNGIGCGQCRFVGHGPERLLRFAGHSPQTFSQIKNPSRLTTTRIDFQKYSLHLWRGKGFLSHLRDPMIGRHPAGGTHPRGTSNQRPNDRNDGDAIRCDP